MSDMSDEQRGGRSPDLSVIVVNWNTRLLSRRCLDSLRAHAEGLALDVIVVDNASSDGSQQMLCDDYPWVALTENDHNVGFARANNVGAARASAPLLLLLNSDAAVLPGTLRAAVAYMDAHPRVVIAGLRLLNDDLTPQPSGRELPSLLSTIVGLLPVPVDWRIAYDRRRNRRDDAVDGTVGEVSGAAMVVRRDVFQRLGGFDERYYFFGEDIDLCWRARETGGDVAYIAAARAIHTWGGARGRTPSLRQALLSQRAQYLLLRRHAPVWQAEVLRIFLVALTVARLARLTRVWGRSRRDVHLLTRELIWILRH